MAVMTVVLGSVVFGQHYVRTSVLDRVNMLVSEGNTGSISLSAAGGADPSVLLQTPGGRGVSLATSDIGGTAVSLDRANQLTTLSLFIDAAGRPEITARNPHTNRIGLRISLREDGSAEIYAPRGLHIIEEPIDDGSDPGG